MIAKFDPAEGSLFDGDGRRKYLAPAETRRWLTAAKTADMPTRLFCLMLYYTSCRVSEGLAVTPRHIDAELQRIVFRTLKRRKRVFRAVPVPMSFVRRLVSLSRTLAADDRLFPWSRQTAWRRVKALMLEAGIEGPQATPRGLRHRYGVEAVMHGIDETLLRRLLGHAPNSKSTRIYTNAMGDEEREIVRRIWR